MPTKEENVLVIPRGVFDEVGAFQGFRGEAAPYMEKLLDRANNFFMPRSKAEDDPTHKQIIPYAVFTHAGRILHYVRGGSSGEKRLVKKGSIGIGGHINDSDESLFSFDESAYHQAVRREIAEELRIGGGWTERIVGLINDDSTEVGRVHLGVVHVVEMETAEVQAGEKAIAELAFLTVEELGRRLETLETWSQILLSHWDEISSSQAQ